MTLPVSQLRVSGVTPGFREAPEWQRLVQLGVGLQFAEVQDGLGGVRLAYSDVASLGVDRWLAMLAVHKRVMDEDVILVSAGTAITVDLLSRSGVHFGGYIVPGVQTAARSLWRATDGVGAPSLELAKNWQPGKSTLQCVESGFAALFTGFLLQVTSQAQSYFVSPKIIMTGGDADTLAKLLPNSFNLRVWADLVLDGLAVALP